MENKNKIKEFSAEEVASFCDQMAMLLNSGIPVYEGAYILSDEISDGYTKQVLKKIEEMVRENSYLYEALEETGAFPSYMVYMVKVGEITGKLEEVLHSLARYYERESAIRAAIKSAVTFPILLFAMMSVIMLVMVTKIIPMFEEMLTELNSQVADSTKVMLHDGITFGKVICIVTILLFCVLLLVIFGLTTKKGRKGIANLAEWFRPTERIAGMLATGQFVSSVSLMTASGMEQQEALKITLDGCKNKKVKKKIEAALSLMEEGVELDEALSRSGLIVGRENRMIAVALRSGASDEIFAKLSRQYDDKTATVLQSLSGRIETGMVVLLAVMVGAILISIMLPLVSMISSIG